MVKSHVYIAALAVSRICGAGFANAQAMAPEVVPGDIVVTAERRETRLRDTPIAISAVSGGTLQAQQVKTLQDLSTALPSLSFSRATNNVMLAVRGIGAIDLNVGTENRVAIHVDGVYVSRPGQALNQFFDVERIEYLRGPQGTLYGRNATAGAINIITRDPTSRPEGYATVTVGNYSTLSGEGAINVPLSAAWSSRIAVSYNRNSGYDRDLMSGRKIDNLDTGAVRGKLKYEDGQFKLVLSADYGKEVDRSGGFRYLGAGSPHVTPVSLLLGGAVATPPDIATDAIGFPYTRNEYYSGSAQGEWSFGDNGVTAIAGYRHSGKANVADIDGGNLPVATAIVSDRAKQITGELRFHRRSDHYDLLAGIFYLWEDTTGLTPLPLSQRIIGGAPIVVEGILSGGRQKTNSLAGFAQLRWNFSSQFYADLGARMSSDHKSIDQGFQIDFATPYSPSTPKVFNATVHDSHGWTSFDPKLTLGFKPSNDVLAYATVARGYQTGGFSFGALQPPYAPERITDFEAGLKIVSADRKIIANVSAFYYDYRNIQANLTTGVTPVITNAARAKIKGAELELHVLPVTGLDLGLNAEYLDASYKDFLTFEDTRPELGIYNLAGNRLPQAPKYRVRLTAAYGWKVGDGDLNLSGDATRVGRIYFTPYQRAEASSAPNTEYNAYLAYNIGNWSASIYARNISNYRRVNYINVASGLFGFPLLGSISAPRTYGASVTRRW